MLLLIQYTLIFASVLLLVALGGCISEHSGVINLGLEGIMVVGALGGALVMSSLSTASPFVMVLVAMLSPSCQACCTRVCWALRPFISRRTRRWSVRQ